MRQIHGNIRDFIPVARDLKLSLSGTTSAKIQIAREQNKISDG
jgi:hypothetical protein